MRKKIITTVFEAIIIFSMIFIYNTFFYSNYDHIIDFTHCYSIANGLKIYKDFNIVVGPIYPIFISIFLKIFGKTFLTFNLINSLLVVIIYLIIKKFNKNTLAILIISCCCYALTAKYNTFTLLLFYIIYYIDKGNNKYKDYLIGFLLSILLFTKINVGCALIIPTIVLNIKSPKIILKRFIPFFITSSIIIFIMWLKGVLPGFINYTLLGLISFTKNSKCDLTVVLVILSAIYIIKNIKKDKYLIYMLCYLIICYPLFESGHVLIGIFPTIIYMLDKMNKNNEKKVKLISLIITIIVFALLIITENHRNNYDLDTKVFKCETKYCSHDKMLNKVFGYVHSFNNHLKKQKQYRIFNFTNEAYFFKLDINEKVDKYDFIWDGNMGYKGEKKIIKEINDYCKDNKCMFIINKRNIYNRNRFDQINLRILKYVEETYNEITDDNYFNSTFFSVYTNDKTSN